MATATHIPLALARDIVRALEDVRMWRRMGDSVGESAENDRLNDLLAKVPKS